MSLALSDGCAAYAGELQFESCIKEGFVISPNVALKDILKTSDNSYICNFLNHIRNFVKTAIEYVFRKNLCRQLEPDDLAIAKKNQETWRLGTRGSQLTAVMLMKYLQSKEKDKFILKDLTDNEFTKNDFSNFDTVNSVSIPIRVEGFRNSRSHIVNIKIIKNYRGRFDIEFFDSRGYGLSHPMNINALKVVQLFIKSGKDVENIKCAKQRIQTDGHSCGAFVAWHATTQNHFFLEDINEFRLRMVRESVADFKEPVVKLVDYDDDDDDRLYL